MAAEGRLADRATILVGVTRSRLDVADPRDDVRGRRVVDVRDEEVGIVDDLLIDDDQYEVRMLQIEHGGILGIGADYYPVPQSKSPRGSLLMTSTSTACVRV